MEEKDLIQKLSALKSIKLDNNRKNKDMSGILALARKRSAENELYKVSIWDLLFRPIPKTVLTGLTVVFVIGSLALSLSISKNNFYGELPEIAGYDNKEMENNRETELANKEMNGEIGNNKEMELVNNKEMKNNKEISPLLPNDVNVDADSNNDSFTSINNEEDLLEAFRVDLMARVNRVWVLSLESGNKEAFAVAQEAEKFFEQKDYDAALRAIGVAEEMIASNF